MFIVRSFLTIEFYFFFIQLCYYPAVEKISIYIDGNNLYRAARELCFEIDYNKFRGWLRQKYNSNTIYIFIGFIPERKKFYQRLEEYGFILIFKETISIGKTVKGNCDAELVLKTVSDFYTNSFTSCILITGDGDFGCLVKFLENKKSLNRLIAPDKNKCSFLLRNKNIEITFLNEQYHKFSKNLISRKEKAPDADVSAQGSFS
jgi:hypothetical protein